MKRIIETIERPPASYCSGEDGSLDKFISGKNVEHFGELLKTEFDPNIRKMLNRLLEIEQAKWLAIVTPKAVSKKIKRKATVLCEANG